MSLCGKCGNEIKDGINFCNFCGTSVQDVSISSDKLPAQISGLEKPKKDELQINIGMTRKKIKYLGIIVGTIVGLLITNSHSGYDFYLVLPVPLGIIGYAIGALFEDE